MSRLSRNQLAAISAAAFHVVATDMRGYGQTDRPEEIEKYTVLHLVGDMVGLLDALGAEAALYVRLHIGWRHQEHPMPKGLEFACPMVRRCAGLDPNEARWQLLEKSNDVPALQLAPDHNITFRVDAVDLKN